MEGFKRLIREVHRRSLWQVLGIYLVGAWIALQVVDVLVNNFRLPPWFPAFALALLVIGLPVVLATAFVQDGVGARGSSRGAAAPSRAEDRVDTAAESRQKAPPPTSGRGLFTWRNALLGGMAAFALWGLLAAGWLLLGPNGSATAADSRAEAAMLRSIAVLPFDNRSAREDDEFFVEGIHDDILSQLSKIDSLRVISRTSVMRYRGSGKSIPEIASELGVETVLEGGVQRAGDRVRVTVQLIDSRSDKHLWAENYDAELSAANIFAIQTDLARKIATALRATLTPETEQRLEIRPTESLAAYDLYQRGRYLYHKGTKDAREAAVELFEQAIAEDSSYAPAYAGLADTYLSLARRGFLPTDEAVAKASPAVEKALALDQDLAEAHASAATLLETQGRLEEAEEQFKRAIALNPGYGEAHGSYGILLVDLSRFDAAAREFETAVALDPLSRRWRANLAFVHAFNGNYEASIEQARKIIDLEPDYDYGYYVLGIGLTFSGQHEEAIAAVRRSAELQPEDLYNLAGLAFVHARAGNRDSAVALAAEVEERGGSLKEIALVYGALGELDKAFEYLDRAYETDPSDMTNLAADPSTEPLRDDPRFDELLEKLGLR